MVTCLVLGGPPGVEVQSLVLRRFSEGLRCERVIDGLTILIEKVRVALLRLLGFELRHVALEGLDRLSLVDLVEITEQDDLSEGEELRISV